MPEDKKKVKISTKEIAYDLVRKHFPTIFSDDLMPELDGSEVGDEVWAIISEKQKKSFKFPTSSGSRKMCKIPATCSVPPKDNPIIGEIIQKQITANSAKIEGILKKTLEGSDDDLVDDDDDNDDDESDEKEELNSESTKIDNYNEMIINTKRNREKTADMSPQFVKSLALTEERAAKTAKILETDEQWLKLSPPNLSVTIPKAPTLIPLTKLSKMFVEAVEKDDKDVDEHVYNTSLFLTNLKSMLAQQNPEQEMKKTEILNKKNSLLEQRDLIDKELEALDNQMKLMVDEKKQQNLALYEEKLKVWQSAAEKLRNLNVEKRKAMEKETEDKEKDWLDKLLN